MAVHPGTTYRQRTDLSERSYRITATGKITSGGNNRRKITFRGPICIRADQDFQFPQIQVLLAVIGTNIVTDVSSARALACGDFID